MRRIKLLTLSMVALLLVALALSPALQETNAVEIIRQEILANKTERALELADAAAAEHPDDTTILGLQALAAERNNHNARARTLAEKVLSASPGQLEASLVLAELAFGLGDFKSAIAHGTAAAKGTFKGDALEIVARAHMLTGNTAAAAQTAKEALPHIGHFQEVQRENAKEMTAYLARLGNTPLYQLSGSGVSKLKARIINTKVNISIGLNGKEVGEFVVDTGNAGQISITKKLADKLDLKMMGNLTARGAASSFNGWLSMLDEITIGDFTIKNVPVMVTKKMVGAPDGNMGRAILMRFNTAIDYSNDTVSFAALGTNPLANAMDDAQEIMRIPFLYRNLMLVNTQLNELEAVPFVFDTGAPYLIVAESFHKRIGLKPIRGGQPMRAQGAGGKCITITPLRIGKLGLGHSVWHPTRALGMEMSELLKLQKVPFYGIVGVDLFQSGILEFNMDADEIIFYSPNKAASLSKTEE